MGRPRLYATNAERQRAFRRRLRQSTACVDRDVLERHHARLDRLQRAVFAAVDAGDAAARAVTAASVETLLERLAAYFEACAAAAGPNAMETAPDARAPQRRRRGRP